MSIENELQQINTSSIVCDEILCSLTNECLKDLDAYITTISKDFSNVLSIDNITLDNFILNLPMLIYYANYKLEQLGLKNDLSEIERKKQITEILTKGDLNIKNKSDKQLAAELQSVDIVLLEDIYERAYKIVKSKIDTAYEILASCKKIMSRRIEELKVQNSDTGRIRNEVG